MHTGRNVSKIRKRLGIPLEQLAQLLKIRRKTLVRIEHTAQMSEQVIERVVQVLEISRGTITAYDETSVRKDLQKAEIIKDRI